MQCDCIEEALSAFIRWRPEPIAGLSAVYTANKQSILNMTARINRISLIYYPLHVSTFNVRQCLSVLSFYLRLVHDFVLFITGIKSIPFRSVLVSQMMRVWITTLSAVCVTQTCQSQYNLRVQSFKCQEEFILKCLSSPGKEKGQETDDSVQYDLLPMKQ